MTFPEFDDFQTKLLAEVVKLKDTKGIEYANSDSRFANFDRLAVRLNIKPTAVALVYLTKHMDAIESYISRGRTYSTETIQGRIVDAINYLTLIAGMIEEDFKIIANEPLEVCPGCQCLKIACLCSLEMQKGDQNQGKHQPFEFDPSEENIPVEVNTFKNDYKCAACDLKFKHLQGLINHIGVHKP